jgi:hypothetical protein
VRFADDNLTSALQGSFELITYADVWYDGEVIYDNLPLDSGSVEFDWDQDIQATLKARIPDPDGLLKPQSPYDPLNVNGQEISISQAIRAEGIIDSDPIEVGRYRIQESRVKSKWRKRPDGVWHRPSSFINVTALDRMQVLADARFLAPTQPPAAATVKSELSRLIGDLVPLGDFAATLTDAAVPRGTIYEDDRVAALQALARSIGGTIVIDPSGAAVLRQPTQYGATPVWTFRVGSDEGFDATTGIADYELVLTRDGVINAVVATGEADPDHAPVQGVAYDLDGSSPSRWDGPFGQVPLFYSSPLLLTNAAAGAAARTRLNNYRRGREREYTVTVPPNPLIELDDPVLLELPDLTVTGRVVRMTLPLTPAAMQITIRALDSSVTVVEV